MRSLWPPPRSLAAVILGLPIFVLALEIWDHWGASDPRNLQYILWKAGYYEMDRGRAWEIFYMDPEQKKFIVGKTRSEIEAKFGPQPLADPNEPYLRICYPTWPWQGKEVLRMRPFIVVMEKGVATELWLVKGC